jgi:UDP-N-acetylglucosamine 1-carboxyvinyltransferase
MLGSIAVRVEKNFLLNTIPTAFLVDGLIEEKDNINYPLESSESVLGSIAVRVGKNFLLNTIPALLLVDGLIEIKDYIPYPDVEGLLDILTCLNVISEKKNGSLFIDTSNYQSKVITHPNSVIRSSFMITGAMLTRDKETHIPVSYGWCTDMQSKKRDCNFHLACFSQMGAKVEISSKENGDELVSLYGTAMMGTQYTFPQVSVTGTVNAVLAALGCEGSTILKNVSLEPEVLFTIKLLQDLGFSIALKSETREMLIEGKNNFKPISLKETLVITLPADRIVAGSLMILPLILSGKLHLTGQDIVKNNLCLLDTLKGIGADINIIDDHSLSVHKPTNQKLKAFTVTAAPFPEIATDLLPFLFVLAAFCEGPSELSDKVYNIRLLSLSKLLTNFNVAIDIIEGNHLVVHGNANPIKKIAPEDESYIEDLQNIHNLRGQTAAFFFLLGSKNKFKIDFRSYGSQITRGYPYPYIVQDLQSIRINIKSMEI